MPSPRPWPPPGPEPGLGHGYRLRVRQDSTNTCLPQPLLSLVPNCAVSCVQAFATSSYLSSSCTDTSDLNFLCTTSNQSGLTIGEGSLQCVVSFCDGQDQQNLAVYNVCDGVTGAIPQTAQTITATIFQSTPTTSSSMENLPQSVSTTPPIEEVSMIVMASGSSPVDTAATSTANGNSSGHTSAQGAHGATSTATPSAVAAPSQNTESDGLGTPVVVGIAIGGAAVVLVTIALLIYIFCVRKKRMQRRRQSKRRSRPVDPTPPPNYQSPEKKQSPIFSAGNGQLGGPDSTTRFYGLQEAPVQEKRRSFWRRSIPPQDIGVAISAIGPVETLPGEASPISISSQKSASRLLPSGPARTLWPQPLDLGATRHRQQRSRATLYTPTEDAQEKPAEPTSILSDNRPMAQEPQSVVRRPREDLPPLQIHAQSQSATAEAQGAAAPTPKIPSTPTYDNGNIIIASPPRTYTSPSSGFQMMDGTQSGQRAATQMPPPPPSAFANRNVLKKKPPARLPLRVVNSPPVELQEPRIAPAAEMTKPLPHRKDSQASNITTFEEDTTPEETNKQLASTSTASRPTLAASQPRYALQQGGSVIREVTYPTIPRSAAISRQAENPAQPKFGADPGPTIKSTREKLIRAEASFMQTDTTSSDGYVSDETIEWPQPPSDVGSKTSSNLAQSVLKANMAKIRNNAAAANRRQQQMFSPSLDERLSTEQGFGQPDGTPSSRARIIPNKSKTGDLYLTVEI